MKKKHFTGVLMLTAAVALGIVSQVVLSNTVAVVKAATITDVVDSNGKLQNVEIKADGENTIKITHTNGILGGTLNNNYTYGFGTDDASALTAAIAENAEKVKVVDGIAKIKITDKTKLHFVIVNKNDIDSGTNAVGKKLTFTTGAIRPNIDDPEADLLEVMGEPGQEYAEKKDGVTDIDDLDWIDVNSDNKIKASDNIMEGTKKTYLVRVKATATTLASEADDVTFTKTQKNDLNDLMKLSYKVTVKNTKKNTVKVSEEKVAEALETGLKVTARSGEVKFTVKALEKVVGDAVEAVKVTLKATSEMAKNVKGSKLVSKQVFTINIKAGNMTVKESQLNGTKISVTLKVNLKKAPKTVWVMDLSTGKRVKATYKKGKLMFKTAKLV